MIPQDPEGYAVDTERRVVHTRYATHGEGLARTRSQAGVQTLLRGNEASVCRRCYPKYRKPRPRKAG